MNPDKYSSIAILDEECEDEKWEERTTVITSNDHEEYIKAAEAIIHDLISEIKTSATRYKMLSEYLVIFKIGSLIPVCKQTYNLSQNIYVNSTFQKL